MFVVIYMAGAIGVTLALGLPGVIKLAPEEILIAVLTTVTLSAFLALYFHLIRRNKLTLSDLGFRRPGVRMLHLLWQIPVTIIACLAIQAGFMSLLPLVGIEAPAEGSSSGPLADLPELPLHLIVIAVLVVAVLTPIWEEVLFRSAFLDGLSGRFRPAVAIVLSAALFAAVHIIPLSLPYLFAGGVAMALLRRFHQNLWAPIILHATNNGLATMVALSL